jgi:hypothetical protein
MVFKVSDESSGPSSPTCGGDRGEGVDNNTNIFVFMGLNNQSKALQNGLRKSYSKCSTRVSVYTGIPSMALKHDLMRQNSRYISLAPVLPCTRQYIEWLQPRSYIYRLRHCDVGNGRSNSTSLTLCHVPSANFASWHKDPRNLETVRFNSVKLKVYGRPPPK